MRSPTYIRQGIIRTVLHMKSLTVALIVLDVVILGYVLGQILEWLRVVL